MAGRSSGRAISPVTEFAVVSLAMIISYLSPPITTKYVIVCQ
jgi:hypothetical protein